MKLALGTVQIGMRYGVANQTGQVDLAEAQRLLAMAKDQGIDTIDTAILYGDSESVLGQIGVDGWRVTTKLPAIPDDIQNVDAWMQAQIQASLTRLRIPQLDAVLLHRPAQLLMPKGGEIAQALQGLKARGLVRKIGISVYDGTEIDAVTPWVRPDIVQAPLNIFDQRLVQEGWVRRLKQSGVELHTRSVFLQGLLLMPAAKRQSYFDRWRNLWTQWDDWLLTHRLDPVTACLQYVLSQPGVDRVIVGVDSTHQFEQIIQCAHQVSVIPEFNPVIEDVDILNPGKWRLI